MKSSQNHNPTFKFWTPSELILLQTKYGLCTYHELARRLPGRTWYAVRNQANYLGLTHDSNLGRKYSANKRFFSRITPLTSYWAGFIAADGCVRRNRLSMGLAPRDSAHLRQFRADIGYTGPLYEQKRALSILICCQQVVDDLSRHFNVVPRKSLILKPPSNLPLACVKAFIRGLIDGDGSICLRPQDGYPRIVLYGTRAICRWVRQWFDQWTPVTNYPRAVERKIRSNSIWKYAVGGHRAERIASLLLQVKGPKLTRKWGKIHAAN